MIEQKTIARSIQPRNAKMETPSNDSQDSRLKNLNISPVEILRESEFMYIKMIEDLHERQEEEKQKTSNQFNELCEQIKVLVERQQKFIKQQKLDQINLRSFNPTPTQTSQETFRKAGFMLHTDAQALLDNLYNGNYFNKMYSLDAIIEQEFKNDQKSRLVVLHIMSFKPKIRVKGPNVDFEETSINQLLPRKFRFSINFYDFPTYHTETLVYEQNLDNQRRAMMNNLDLILIRESYQNRTNQNKNAVFSFQIDALMNHKEEYIKYFLFKNLFIRLYDAETNLYFGYAQMSLSSLLLGGHKMTQQELQIFSLDWKSTNGSLKVMMEIISLATEVTDEQSMMSTTAFNFSKIKHNKQHLSSTQPIDIRLYGEAQTTKDDQQTRMEERIKNIKRDGDTQINKTYSDFSMKQIDAESRIKCIHQIITQNKATLIKSVIKKNIEQIQEVHVRVGQKKIVLLELENLESSEQTYTIQIIDPDWQYLGENKECTIVHSNLEELNYCIKELKLDDAIVHPEVQFIKSLNGSQFFQCKMKPKSKGPIFLKFYTLRFPTLNEQEVQLKECVIVRDITLLIQLTKSLQTLSGTVYRIIPHNQIIDMVFDFFQASNTQMEAQLPPLFCMSEYSNNKKPTLITSSNNVTFSLNDFAQLVIHTKTSDIGQQTNFHIFAYRDYLCYELLAVWQISIHCLHRVDFHLPIGKLTKSVLTFYSDKKRVVRLYSSNSDILWLEAPYNHEIVIQEKLVAEFQFNIFTVRDIQANIIVNCVDINTNELIYCWVVVTKSSLAYINQVYNVRSHHQKLKLIQIPFKNNNKQSVNLTVLSSDSTTIAILQESFRVQPQETVYLKLRLKSLEDSIGQDVSELRREVKLFVYDIQAGINECYLIKIQYYN